MLFRSVISWWFKLNAYFYLHCRSEIEDIKDIIGKISLNLKYDAFQFITKDLVGIYSQMVELESRLAIESNNVRFLGVWGMGGNWQDNSC